MQSGLSQSNEISPDTTNFLSFNSFAIIIFCFRKLLGILIKNEEIGATMRTLSDPTCSPSTIMSIRVLSERLSPSYTVKNDQKPEISKRFCLLSDSLGYSDVIMTSLTLCRGSLASQSAASSLFVEMSMVLSLACKTVNIGAQNKHNIHPNLMPNLKPG